MASSNGVKYILFDWGGTIAFSGTRDVFLHSLFVSDKLGVLKPEAIKTLRNISNKGIKIAIVTNTDKCIGCMMRALKACKLDKYFEFVLFSNGIGMCKKPCNKIFATAIKKTGVSPGEILFIGNDYEKDIIGANDMGMFTGFLADSPHIYNFAKKRGVQSILLRNLYDILEYI